MPKFSKPTIESQNVQKENSAERCKEKITIVENTSKKIIIVENASKIITIAKIRVRCDYYCWKYE
jgi:hypothetical protein